jgi:hypothetical protein
LWFHAAAALVNLLWIVIVGLVVLITPSCHRHW